MKILIAEDEPKVRLFILQALREAGMTVDSVSTVPDLIVALRTNPYDVLVLDRILEGYDSLKSLKKIRKQFPKIKVLILSALKEVEDKVEGLYEGADDYLTKPFHVSELIARVRTISRREDQIAKTTSPSMIEYEDLKVDLLNQRVSRKGIKIELTGKEFRFIALLAKNPGKIFSKTTLLDLIWDMNHFPESNVVEVTVAKLRGKIDKGHKPLIHSRRGVGYWLGES